MMVKKIINGFLGLLLMGLNATAQPKDGSINQQPPSPLYRDPIYDGAADPVLVYNHAQKEWTMLYTQRRATKRTSIHAAELEFENGTLLCDRDKPFNFWLGDIDDK